MALKGHFPDLALKGHFPCDDCKSRIMAYSKSESDEVHENWHIYCGHLELSLGEKFRMVFSFPRE